jgi:preprotein translocase subunit Sec61beta
MLAASSGNLPCVAYFVSHGADVNIQNSSGMNALKTAAGLIFFYNKQECHGISYPPFTEESIVSIV